MTNIYEPMIDNPNPDNFYSKDEMHGREKYIPVAKKRLLEKMDDLRKKIETEEPFPEKNLSLDDIFDMDSKVEEILSGWYY